MEQSLTQVGGEGADRTRLVGGAKWPMVARRAELSAKAAAARARIDAINRMPLSPMDVRSAFTNAIDASAQDFLAKGGWRALGHHVADVGEPRTVRDHDASVHGGEVCPPQVPLSRLNLLDERGTINAGALCFLFGDVIKERFAEFFGSIFPEPAMPSAEQQGVAAMSLDQRRVLISELQAQAELHDAEIAELDRGLGANGQPVSPAQGKGA